MKPTPCLGHRMRFTTKQVGRGFYRGNRTGSMGSHTEYGGYVIDYRKVRHYKVPDLTDFKLTPFVSKQEPRRGSDGQYRRHDGTLHGSKYVDGLQYIKQWKEQNPAQYQAFWDVQEQEKEQRTQEKQNVAMKDVQAEPVAS